MASGTLREAIGIQSEMQLVVSGPYKLFPCTFSGSP